MADKAKTEELLLEARNFFNYLKKEIGKDIRTGKNVVYINFNDLASFSPVLSEMIISSPEEALQILEVGFEESGLIQNPRVRIKQLPDTLMEKVRNLRAKHLNRFIQIEGIVRQASEVRPQVANAKFECPACGTIISVLQIENRFREPTRCSCGRKGGFKIISKDMVDVQRLVIEESPESLIGGEQPRRISVFLKEDLVEPKMEEKTTPGSRILIVGILKEMAKHSQTGAQLTRYDIYIEANNIMPLDETYEELAIDEEDERQIQELAADPQVFDKLAKSIAPSIYGYDEIKQAILLQMFGGVKKTKSDGTKSRGDMHVLLVGDPGVAKSQMLKFISGIAPKGRYVVGKSASGAGLTATVVRDEFLRGWSLEAGAMVLSHKGMVCIDEIEKMDPQERSAMHEALEQQTVTISKANVQACYSEDTEVLTELGWRKYKDVENLKIAQYNLLDKTIKFLAHKGLYIYDYKGKMYHFKDKRNDILVTPNHTMLVKRENQNKFERINAEDITSYRFKVKNSADFSGEEAKIFILPAIMHKQNRIHPKYTHQHIDKKIPMDLWLEFLGYYITEGGIETAPTIGIVQKKGEKAEKIKRCMNELTNILGCSLSEIDCQEYVRFKITQTQLYDYLKNLGGRCYFKKLGINFSLLSKKQLQILYGAMMLGDGSSDGKYFSCTSKELSDEIQIIAHLTGKSASEHIHYLEGSRKNRKTMFRVSLSDKIEPEMKKSSIQKTEYNGKVFCFSTQTGFFVTRRNGKIAIQGNTLRAETSVLAAGNPKFGRFDPYQTVASQIDIPPTLINRFDVVFVLKDVPDRIKDEAIADHVLTEHKNQAERSVIEADIFRKYIAYAKQRIIPKLTDEAAEELKRFYIDLRNAPVSSNQPTRPLPISARQLDALIRMSEASAKARLSMKVTKEDAKRAINLIKYYMMQVGYDYETKTFDIDRITSGVSTSQRGKIMLVRDIISRLESRIGKLIPIEELKRESQGKLDDKEIDDALEKLTQSGDIFHPRKGFIQRM